MRKALKLKQHSCALCKPHKMRGQRRWKDRQHMLLREAERDIRQAMQR